MVESIGLTEGLGTVSTITKWPDQGSVPGQAML